MDNNKKRKLFTTIIYVANIIVVTIGSTFAYFSALTQSNENAVSMTAATYRIELTEDVSLIKTQVIPSEEKYVDISLDRLDENGDYIGPYQKDGQLITDKTVCVDDNLNEICSIYTFTVINPITDTDLPIQVSIVPKVHTFTNMKYKLVKQVLDETGVYKTVDASEDHWLVDDRYEIDSNTGGYVKDSKGNKIKKSNFAELATSPIVIPNVNEIVPKATDADNPGTATFSIILWVDEINADQTEQDSGQVFAGSIIVDSKNSSGNGITGVFTAGGVDN